MYEYLTSSRQRSRMNTGASEHLSTSHSPVQYSNSVSESSGSRSSASQLSVSQSIWMNTIDCCCCCCRLVSSRLPDGSASDRRRSLQPQMTSHLINLNYQRRQPASQPCKPAPLQPADALFRSCCLYISRPASARRFSLARDVKW